LLSNIEPKQGIALFGFCYSGGFAERFGKGNYVAVSSTQSNEESKADFSDSFDGYFMKGFSGRVSNDSDTNGDGVLDGEENDNGIRLHPTIFPLFSCFPEVT